MVRFTHTAPPPAHPAGTEQLLLRHFPLVQSTSLEETEHLQSSLNAPVRALWFDRAVPFEFRLNVLALDGVRITASSWQAGVHGLAPDVGERYSLMFALRGRAESLQAGDPTPIVPGATAAMVNPSMPGEFRLASGYRGVNIVIPGKLIQTTLAALSGQNALPRFQESIDLRSGGGASLWRLVQYILEEADERPDLVRSSPFAAHLADTLVCALLLSLPHDRAALLGPQRPAEPCFLRRAEEYVEARAPEPISVADLAAAAGVSVRSIQAAFHKHRGCSPMAFLRARRLELARRRLLEPRATTVAAVALECGLEHLGRFSADYRARFGESPAQTLRRRA